MFRKPRNATTPSVGQTAADRSSNGVSPGQKDRMAGTRNPKPGQNSSILSFFRKVDTPLEAVDDSSLFFSSPSQPAKRRKLSPPKEASNPLPVVEDTPQTPVSYKARAGPFAEDSDEEPDMSLDLYSAPPRLVTNVPTVFKLVGEHQNLPKPTSTASHEPQPSLDQALEADAEDEVYEDEDENGEEFLQMKWMERQQQLEMLQDFELGREDCEEKPPEDLSCPICSSSLMGLSDMDASRHVNSCLDGSLDDVAPPVATIVASTSPLISAAAAFVSKQAPSAPKTSASKFLLEVPVALKPFTAFTKLMKGNAEDAAWAAAAAEEMSSRGKPAFERTCPFYKIMPGFFICVDAFRYGAVPGCRAYFLSHFHSDHYIGLSHTWSHGPIYCSKVTANLVRQQLRVDPKYVIDLEFEKKQPVPNTEGVFVTMMSANHCPGSSIFLFEKTGQGKNSRTQRVLHCGDMRCAPFHIQHPRLRPDIIDDSGKVTGHQKLDVCYLDTTYLNPKYAFPEQTDVINACAEMCLTLNTPDAPGITPWNASRSKSESDAKIEPANGSSLGPETKLAKDAFQIMSAPRHRLLVVIGTYSIGKERICVGIAKALKSKIYASAGKARICACLEDPELDALLTRDPKQAQVHMTPLMEIRAETLHEYLEAQPDFTHVVGFRPSGWTYRPPTGRFIESPPVQMVLSSDSWVSRFTVNDLVPQRGSTKEAKCFGVPYSEHSSFKELTMFCCALHIDRIIPTVNIGSAKSREKMKVWIDRWAAEKKKNGLFSIALDQKTWRAT